MTRRDNDTLAPECKPICSKQCKNADCVKPNVCQCRKGYADIDDDPSTCEPICSHSCKNGECVAPNTCTCHDGYKKNVVSWNICDPVCKEECVNGVSLFLCRNDRIIFRFVH